MCHSYNNNLFRVSTEKIGFGCRLDASYLTITSLIVDVSVDSDGQSLIGIVIPGSAKPGRQPKPRPLERASVKSRSKATQI